MLHFRFLFTVCNQSAKSVRNVFVARWVIWPVVAFALTLGLACAQATFTEIPTPIPIPTPSPTPTPAPLPLGSGPVIVEFGPDFNADPDSEKLLQVKDLLSRLPEGYSRMVVVDAGELAETSSLEQVVDLGELGLLPMVQPLLTHALDMMVLASPDSGDGTVVIFQGGVELESLVDLARSLGMAIDPEPEYYQGSRVWSGQILGVGALSLAELGVNTSIIAQGPVTDHSVPELLVKDVLDLKDAPSEGFLDGPVFWGLVDQLLSGPVIVVDDECRNLAELHSDIGLVGCTAAAVSVNEVSSDQVVAHLVLGFGKEVQAKIALPLLRDGLLSSEIQLGEIAIRQEGVLLRVRIVGDTQEILDAL